MNDLSIHIAAIREEINKLADELTRDIVDREQYCYGVGQRAGLKRAVELIKQVEDNIRKLEDDE